MIVEGGLTTEELQLPQLTVWRQFPGHRRGRGNGTELSDLTELRGQRSEFGRPSW